MRLPLAFFLLGPALALAQPSATMRPSLLQAAAGDISYSSREDVARSGTVLGSVAVTNYALSVSGRHALPSRDLLLYGFAYSRHDLSLRGPLPLPDDLTEISFNLGWQRRFSSQWSGGVFLRPGLYSASSGWDSDSFNVPVLALAHYTPRPNLTWSIGLNFNAFSDRIVLPAAGVRWSFAPDWTFTLGYPRSGFGWQVRPDLLLRTGVKFQGGSFRVSENLGVPAPGINRLANTFVQYREVRVGVGADYTLSDRLSLSAEAGVMTDRKFEYFDRGYRLNGEAGTFVEIGLNSTF